MQRELTGVQHRAFAFDDCEVRSVDGGDGFTFEGVASIVDKTYTATDNLGAFPETIQRGAFDKTLSELKARSKKGGVGSDVGLFINHNYSAAPLATVSAGSLELWTDPNLRVRARLNPARPSVQEIRHAVNDGEMRQMSIGFKVPKGKSDWSADGEHIVREALLVETSVVWLGDNHMTTAGMRSLTELISDLEDADEATLRRAIDALTARLPGAYPVELDPTLIVADPTPFLEQRRADLISMWAKRYA